MHEPRVRKQLVQRFDQTGVRRRLVTPLQFAGNRDFQPKRRIDQGRQGRLPLAAEGLAELLSRGTPRRKTRTPGDYVRGTFQLVGCQLCPEGKRSQQRDEKM